MARVKPKEFSVDIVADWRTGSYTIRTLAEKYRVGKSFVGNLVKGVEKDTSQIVDSLVKGKQGLALLDGRNIESVLEVVDSKTKHLIYFSSVAIQNVQEAMARPCMDQMDFKCRAETILKGKETVIGKEPTTAVQINNSQTVDNRSVTPIEYENIATRLLQDQI
jgi:hypothetical protein